jgi:LmbE family N-acetylglucosaminyl deacetylase
MPGPDYAGIVTFYEDFPYAWWNGFRRWEDLPFDPAASLPPDVGLQPEYADIGDELERKISGIRLYESQVGRLFHTEREMADAVRAYARQIAELGRVDGFAERYWASGRA